MKIYNNICEVKTLVSVAPNNFKDEARKLELPYDEINHNGEYVSYVIDFNDIEALESVEGMAKELKLIASGYRLEGYKQITLDE